MHAKQLGELRLHKVKLKRRFFMRTPMVFVSAGAE
jgi:hypothetical protein